MLSSIQLLGLRASRLVKPSAPSSTSARAVVWDSRGEGLVPSRLKVSQTWSTTGMGNVDAETFALRLSRTGDLHVDGFPRLLLSPHGLVPMHCFLEGGRREWPHHAARRNRVF